MIKIKNYLKHPLFSGSVMMVGGSLFINGINYVYHLFMGRILGPSNYGVLASLYSILYIVSIIPMSASFAIVKFISSAKNSEERANVYVGVKNLIFWISIASSFLILILSPQISVFLNIRNIYLVGLVSPILFLTLVTLVNQATSQGLLQFSGVVVPNFISGFAKLVLGLILVYLGFSVMGAMVGVLLSVILAYIISIKFVSQKIKGEKAGGNFNKREFLNYSFPVLVQSVALTSLITFDVLLVKHFLSPYEAGLYAALSTLGKIIYFAAQPITATMFPIISGRSSRGEKYHKILFISIATTILISISILAFYLFFPDLSIGLLYGKDYLSASPDLFLMGLFMTIYTFCYLLINYRLSLGDTKIVLLPVFFALFQLAGIFVYHKTIMQVIQVSLLSSILLAASLFVTFGYNMLWQKIYSR